MRKRREWALKKNQWNKEGKRDAGWQQLIGTAGLQTFSELEYTRNSSLAPANHFYLAVASPASLSVVGDNKLQG